MATAAQVLQLLEQGKSYEQAARELGIPAGQAFMLATGLPADGSGVPTPKELVARGLLPASPQHLVNPPAHNPGRDEHVLAWVRERAARDLQPPAR